MINILVSNKSLSQKIASSG